MKRMIGTALAILVLLCEAALRCEARAAVALVAGAHAAAAAGGGEVRLTLHPRLPEKVAAQVQKGDVKLNWPFTFGVPFPEGTLKSDANLKLTAPDGLEAPIQVRTTGRWLDGSIRWVLIDCIVPLTLVLRSEALLRRVVVAKGAYRLQWGEGVARAASPGMKVTARNDADTLRINTGLLAANLSKKDMSLFQSVSGAKGRLRRQHFFPSGKGSDIFLEDQTGRIFRGSLAGKPEVVVEEPGPIRVSVKIEGWTQAEDGQKLGRHIVRIQAFAGQRWMRMYHTFVNTADSEEVQFRNIALHFRFTGDSYRFHGVGGNWTKRPVGSDYLLQHGHNAFEVVSDGKMIHKGKKARGRVTVGEGRFAWTASVRHFWQNFPKEIEVARGGLNLHVWPRHGKPPAHLGKNMTAKNIGALWWVHEGKLLDFKPPKQVYDFSYTKRKYNNIKALRLANAFGIAKTHEFCLDFHGSKGVSPEVVGEVFQANPMMVVDPQWVADSQAFWNIAPRSKHYAAVEEASERTLLFLPAMMDRIGDYGMWNWGSYHQSYLPALDAAVIHRHWPGFHHGGPRWPWLVFVRTGEPPFFDYAEVHSRHLMDTCVCNWEDPAYNKKYWNSKRWWAHNWRLKYKGGLCRYKGIAHWFGGARMFYNSQVDYALWHYYLTGYQRAWDVAMAKGEFLLRACRRLDHRESGRVFLKRLGAGRGCMAITLYRATHDKRYLDLAREQMEHFMKAADTEPNDGVRNIYYAPFAERYWETTHDEKVKPYIIRWARQRLQQNQIWSGRDPFYNLMALGYQFTGDAAFLKHGLAQARVMLENRATGVDPVLEGVIPTYFSGPVGYLGQQWGRFVKALNQHSDKTGERLALPELPDAIPTSFRLRPVLAMLGWPESECRGLVLWVRKAAGEEVHIPFNVRIYGKPHGPVRVTDPKGKVVMEKEIVARKGRFELNFTLARGEATGDYRIEFRANVIAGWPLPGKYRKLVAEMPFWMRDAAGFYFLPIKKKDGKPGTIRFRTRIRPKYFQVHRIYRPDGTLHLVKTEQGHVHGNYDIKMTIPPEQQGALWLYSNGSLSHSDGVALSGDVAPVAAFVREQFFVPACFETTAARPLP